MEKNGRTQNAINKSKNSLNELQKFFDIKNIYFNNAAHDLVINLGIQEGTFITIVLELRLNVVQTHFPPRVAATADAIKKSLSNSSILCDRNARYVTNFKEKI